MIIPCLKAIPHSIPLGIAIVFLQALSLASGVAEITVLGTSANYTSGAGSGGQTHSLSFDPGATSTAIVVAVVMEAGGAPSAVTFGGVPMEPAVAATGSNVGIYYLNNPTTGGPSDLVFDYSSVATVNFIAFKAVSLNASGTIESNATATDTDLDLTLPVPSSGNFVIAGLNFNNGAGSTTTQAAAPLTGMFGQFINSGGGSFGYAQNVASGNQDYSFTLGGGGAPVPRRITAASFNVVSTSPSDPLMATITPAVAPATGFDLKWNSQIGMTYAVLTSAELSTPVETWSSLASDLPANPPQNTYHVPGDGSRRFYVIKETPAP